MRIEATNRTGIESRYPRIPGTNVSTARIPITQSMIVRKERSQIEPLHGGGRSGGDVPDAEPKRLDHRRDRLDERDDAARRHCPGSDVADVAVPDLPRGHVADQHLGLGIQRFRHARSPDVDERDDDEPRERRSGDHDRGDPDAEDVADADQGRRNADRELRLERQDDLEGADDELETVGDQLEEHTDAEAQKHAAGLTSAALRRDQDLGAGQPLRVGQLAVLALDQVAPERDHREHAEQTAGHGEQGDLAQAGLIPQMNRAGIVNSTPEATEELAEPTVCDMLLSRMVCLRPKAVSSRNATT